MSKQETVEYDPESEPIDSVEEAPAGGEGDTPEKAHSEDEAEEAKKEETGPPDDGTAPTKSKRSAKVKSADKLLRDLRKVARLTPPVTAGRELANARVADTGRALTDRQASAVLRIQAFVTRRAKRRETFESRKYGDMPCVKPAHATLWLLDRLADMIEEIDGEG